MRKRSEQRRLQSRASQLFARYGKLFEYNLADPITRNIYSNHQAQIEGMLLNFVKSNNLDIDIVAAFIDDAKIQAFAAKNDGTYLIGVHAGTVHYLYSLCRVLMSSDYAYPYLGGSRRKFEFNPDPRTVAIYAPIEAYGSFDDEELDAITSNIFTSSLAFIVGHELCHIIGGHLDYYIHMNNAEIFDTPIGLVNQGIPRREAQAMEFHADGLAFSTMMARAIKMMAPPDLIAITDWLKDGNTRVHNNVFASYAVFKTMASGDDNYMPLISSHPPSYMRARFLQTIAWNALTWTDIPIKTANDIFVATPLRWAFDAYVDQIGEQNGSFDELVQGPECLSKTLDLKLEMQTLQQVIWRRHAKLEPTRLKRISFDG